MARRQAWERCTPLPRPQSCQSHVSGVCSTDVVCTDAVILQQTKPYNPETQHPAAVVSHAVVSEESGPNVVGFRGNRVWDSRVLGSPGAVGLCSAAVPRPVDVGLVIRPLQPPAVCADALVYGAVQQHPAALCVASFRATPAEPSRACCTQLEGAASTARSSRATQQQLCRCSRAPLLRWLAVCACACPLMAPTVDTDPLAAAGEGTVHVLGCSVVHLFVFVVCLWRNAGATHKGCQWNL